MFVMLSSFAFALRSLKFAVIVSVTAEFQNELLTFKHSLCKFFFRQMNRGTDRRAYLWNDFNLCMWYYRCSLFAVLPMSVCEWIRAAFHWRKCLFLILFCCFHYCLDCFSLTPCWSYSLRVYVCVWDVFDE